MNKHSVFTNMRESKVSVGGVDFAPGDTKEIPPEHLDALNAVGIDGKPSHPLRKHGVRGPILKPGKVEMPTPMLSESPATLEDLDNQRALAQVRLCTNIPTLEAWYTLEEKRPEVAAAIVARGKELSARAKD